MTPDDKAIEYQNEDEFLDTLKESADAMDAMTEFILDDDDLPFDGAGADAQLN